MRPDARFIERLAHAGQPLVALVIADRAPDLYAGAEMVAASIKDISHARVGDTVIDADDPATAVGLAYIEGITDGRGLMDRLAGAAARKPLVVVKGGSTEGGAQAAASHTGALAADDKVFDGACRAAGLTRADSIESAARAGQARAATARLIAS